MLGVRSPDSAASGTCQRRVLESLCEGPDLGPGAFPGSEAAAPSPAGSCDVAAWGADGVPCDGASAEEGQRPSVPAAHWAAAAPPSAPQRRRRPASVWVAVPAPQCPVAGCSEGMEMCPSPAFRRWVDPGAVVWVFSRFLTVAQRPSAASDLCGAVTALLGIVPSAGQPVPLGALG